MRFFGFLIVWLALAGPAAASPWGPWDRPEDAALPPAAYHRGEEVAATATNHHWVFALLLRAYQLTLSGQDIARCPMYPSCSRFAMEAYTAYGPLAGTLMTADRLLRDHGRGHERYRRIRVGMRTLLLDPPVDHAPW